MHWWVSSQAPLDDSLDKAIVICLSCWLLDGLRLHGFVVANCVAQLCHTFHFLCPLCLVESMVLVGCKTHLGWVSYMLSIFSLGFFLCLFMFWNMRPEYKDMTKKRSAHQILAHISQTLHLVSSVMHWRLKWPPDIYATMHTEDVCRAWWKDLELNTHWRSRVMREDEQMSGDW